VPYTKQEERDPQYMALQKLAQVIKNKGDLNHAICELTAMLMMQTGGMGYTNVSNWIDGVHGAERELTRRLLNPYEDVKIEENGDLRSFKRLLEQLD